MFLFSIGVDQIRLYGFKRPLVICRIAISVPWSLGIAITAWGHCSVSTEEICFHGKLLADRQPGVQYREARMVAMQQLQQCWEPPPANQFHSRRLLLVSGQPSKTSPLTPTSFPQHDEAVYHLDIYFLLRYLPLLSIQHDSIENIRCIYVNILMFCFIALNESQIIVSNTT